jgi:DNA-directed RNA polymerase subunit RPC12/RpoP
MRIAVVCPRCGHRGRAPAPDNANGHNVRCSRCGQPFTVVARRARTAQVGVACPGCGREITLASHELSILVECAGCATRFVPSQLGQADAPQAPAPAEPSANPPVSPAEDLEETDGVPPEPWYYRFLEVVTKVGLLLNLIGIGIGVCVWLVWVLRVVAALATAKPDESALVDAGAIFSGMAMVPYSIGLVVWLLVALTAAGWSFLMLDAARNLRLIRYAAKP